MDNNIRTQENRREHIRVSASLHFCVTLVEGVDPDTQKFIYGDCFCALTTDISLGGIRIAHNGKVNVGFEVEISTPEVMSREKCLSCKESFMHKNDLALTPLYGRIVWVKEGLCGIKFTNVKIRNENILSKYIWDEHLETVRKEKSKIVRQPKF
ncbi:MAG: hypothetical protein C0603_11425 [Denitrovibrio sp.]|nr:MAG: hypothetical protein C0603_11425 [Denitrovibrio sp.]